MAKKKTKKKSVKKISKKKTNKKTSKEFSLKKYKNIVFCGIGGSSVPGEVVQNLNLKIPVLIAKEEFPDCADKDSLCFVISYSGNTHETINLYKEAKKRKCKIIIVTSGGELSKKKEKILKVPEGYLPREAFPSLLFPVLKTLKIDYKECEELIKKIDRTECEVLAEELKNRIPIIYSGSENLKCVSYRWQTFFNENSKRFAHANYFPELSHNEIEAVLNKNFQVIFLIDKETKPIQKAKELLNPIVVKLDGKTHIGKIFYGFYFGFLVSVDLAKLLNIDYKKTEKIDKLKEK